MNSISSDELSPLGRGQGEGNNPYNLYIYSLTRLTASWRLQRPLPKGEVFWGVYLLTLIFGIFLFLLTGCTPHHSPSAVHIKFACWGSDEELRVTRHLIARFEEEHPRIQVDLMHIPDQYYQKIHLLMAADLTPDVVMSNNLQLPVYASAGQLHDLCPFLGAGETDAFFPQAIAALSTPIQHSGPLYALPRDLSVLVVFVNTALYQQKNLLLPRPGWTWKEMLAQAKTLTDLPHNQFGVSFYQTPPLFWLPFFWSAIPGRQFVNAHPSGQIGDDKRLFPQLTPKGWQAAMEGLQFYADLRNRWHVAPTQAQSGNATMTQMFLQQKLALLVSGPWVVPVLNKQANFSWRMLPFPAGLGGSRIDVDASGYAMAARTEHPKEAWALIHFLTSRAAVAQVAATGLILPARIDCFMDSLTLTHSPKEREQLQVYWQAVHTGIPTQTPPRWNELSETWGQAMEPVWEGRTTAAEAMAGVRSSLEAVLKP